MEAVYLQSLTYCKNVAFSVLEPRRLRAAAGCDAVDRLNPRHVVESKSVSHRATAWYSRCHESSSDQSVRSTFRPDAPRPSGPKPGPHDVLIAIDTAGVGTWDASIREGSRRKPGRSRLPLTLGVDGGGLVVARGARVRRIKVGDRVYAYECGNRQGG